MLVCELEGVWGYGSPSAMDSTGDSCLCLVTAIVSSILRIAIRINPKVWVCEDPLPSF